MVIITYDNFRELECEYAKYISQKKEKFKINIVRYLEFKKELLSTFSDEEIRHFFEIFPYTIDSEVTGFDILMSVRLEIAFYDDLYLIEREGHEFVLVDQGSEFLEGVDFLSEITSQPIGLQEFATISFFDFSKIAQEDLIYSINYNLRYKESGQAKYVEKEIKEGLYI
ncbi:MAG: hypothetical protein KAW66_13740 [Candidatus Lokiarchaeota archaeon]|nr:hypothetical protein [Candidatus Lokiarchaeota archaeon]